MEVKRQERGRFRGNIDWQGSMETMAINESWTIPESEVALRTVRNAVSRATRNTDKVFTSQCPGLTFPFITIKRIR